MCISTKIIALHLSALVCVCVCVHKTGACANLHYPAYYRKSNFACFYLWIFLLAQNCSSHSRAHTHTQTNRQTYNAYNVHLMIQTHRHTNQQTAGYSNAQSLIAHMDRQTDRQTHTRQLRERASESLFASNWISPNEFRIFSPFTSFYTHTHTHTLTVSLVRSFVGSLGRTKR